MKLTFRIRQHTKGGRTWFTVQRKHWWGWHTYPNEYFARLGDGEFGTVEAARKFVDQKIAEVRSDIARAKYMRAPETIKVVDIIEETIE